MLIYENVFELFDLSVRRLQNGDKLKVVLECAENLEIEKKIIEFRGKSCKTNFVFAEDENDLKIGEFVFEVFDIKCRRLSNGDKLRIVLENLYEKEQELKIVPFRQNQVKVHFEEIPEDITRYNNEEDEDDL